MYKVTIVIKNFKRYNIISLVYFIIQLCENDLKILGLSIMYLIVINKFYILVHISVNNAIICKFQINGSELNNFLFNNYYRKNVLFVL